ncbi:GH36-type glycosyl hydrolase domain-containing protein [Rhizobium sp. NPDC092011]|uniref:GH36-type glycosyl hydrolase domain-containing protein n=1 Tax=Rhizobium sp. NPDC092011 TaxID=3364500 RepID=UPI003819A06C
MVSQNLAGGSTAQANSPQTDPDFGIRATLLSNDQLRARAARFAESRQLDVTSFGNFDFFQRHRENESEILRVYKSAAADVDAGESITPATEWLLDNHYIVEEAIQEVRRDFRKKFYRELRTIKLNGVDVPRTLALAWLYMAHAHSNISNAGMAAVTEGFQDVQTLHIGELWAMPSLVRYVLIDNLRRVATRIDKSREMRGIANDAANKVITLGDAKSAEFLEAFAANLGDSTFVTQLHYRLRNALEPTEAAIGWLEAKLAANGTDAETVLSVEQSRLAAANTLMGSIIKSLREINDTDWSTWVEEVSKIDKLLWKQTDYAELDSGSRNSYRRQIEKLAKRSEKTELDIAEAAIKLAERASTAGKDAPAAAANVGYFLVGAGRPALEAEIGFRKPLGVRFMRAIRRLNWLAIAVPVLTLTLLALIAVGDVFVSTGVPLFATIILLLAFALPASEGATGLFNFFATFFIAPDRLIGYEFKKGLPAEARTLVTIPSLIGKREHVDELLRNLEVHYLANPRGEIYYALLSDWPDSQEEQNARDLEVLDYARRQMANLDARYAENGKQRFYLLHRRRLYNEAEGAWMGWERKRGKLHELNMLLRGDPNTTFLPGADTVPQGVKYVMTLDSDTRIIRDTVTKLVGKLHHPINRPVFDEKSQRVVDGYSVLQPRVTPSLTTGKDASAFQRIFSVNRGLDPYVFAVSDVYQDITGEGTFTGKGLYHVDAFEASLKGRIAENSVLSHDLLEGSMARCALVTDCELVEDFPIRYEVEVSRQHRWARGDWQLLPYIFDPKRGVTALGRWKMADNLRRSLTPIAWFLASALGWYWMSPLGALLWQIVLIFSLFVAPTLSLINGIIPRTSDIILGAHLHMVWTDIQNANAQVALRVVFIADSACVMADAILRSLYRLFVSHKLMLQWRTAASAQASAQTTILGHYKVMWRAPVLAILALLFAMYSGDSAYLVGVPFIILWVLSPMIAWIVSQTAETEDRLVVPDKVRSELRKIARRTWRYFDNFVVPGQHYLPPDNVQQTPHAVVAMRTSPTNIGVYLLSVISARQFGWISFEEAVKRIEQTIDTTEKLEKYRGHLFNWYHTDTLKPLGRKYVSSVDSGNLAGHLIAVGSACRSWAQLPTAQLHGSLDGIGDIVGILREVLAELADDNKISRDFRDRVDERIAALENTLAAAKQKKEFSLAAIERLVEDAREIGKRAADLDQQVKTARSEEVVYWAGRLVATCELHLVDNALDQAKIDAISERLIAVGARARDIAFAMDFSFLFRPERRLLSIGFRVETEEVDAACYDLLASEARLTSLFAVAKGDLPTEHWYKLGRHVVPVGPRGALVSWSGSMFEYLMPPLVMQERQGGILNQTNNLIVQEQMNYAKRLGVGIPWGISEAAFNARDHQMNYQYSNFGVPTLGLKRGLGQNAVIAPYASLLASQYNPIAALENLEKLKAVGALGMYGFHDAVDFTPSRVPEGKKCAVVYNYYAHHHGMSIAAVANVAFDGLLRELFHADPVIEAAELLLQEKAPRDIPVMASKHETDAPANIQGDLMRPEVRRVEDPASRERELLLLSNGRYSTMLTATGAGYTRWNNLSINRWRADPTEDRWGSFLLLRDMASHEWWSATAEPRSIANEHVRVTFSDDKAEFVKTVGELTSEMEVFIASDHDAEGRRLTITNSGTEDRVIEVTSYMEPVATLDVVDTGHPVFARMFVHTEIAGRGDAIFVERRKRGLTDPEVAIAQLVVDGSGGDGPTQFETDRMRFLGRGRTLTEAAAFDEGATLSGTDGFTMDACVSLRRVVRVPAGQKVSLTFWTIAAGSRAELDTAVEHYRQPDSFAQGLVQAWTRTQKQLRQIGVNSKEAAAYQRFARYIVYPEMSLRADSKAVRAGLKSQSVLWGATLSGDAPLITLRITDELGTDLVKELLRAQGFLQSRGVEVDLVLFNERTGEEASEMQRTIDQLCDGARHASEAAGIQRNIYVIRKDLTPPDVYDAIIASSRVVLRGREGSLNDQLERARSVAGSPALLGQWGDSTLVPRMTRSKAATSAVDGSDLAFWNGYGGFAADGSEYVVRLSGGEQTPHPWVNIMANESFGFHVSAEGAAFTWSQNSRDHQLTPWTNDMVTNRPGEAFYLKDLDRGSVIVPYAALAQNSDTSFEVRHGLGYSVFSTVQDEITLEVTQTLHMEKPVKLTQLRIRNAASVARKLRLYGYAEWILGNNPTKSKPFIVSEFDKETGVLFASNPFSVDFGTRVASFAASEKPSSVSGSRREFIGRHGTIQQPRKVSAGARLSDAVELDGDPAAAMAFDLTIEPGAVHDICFYMGDAGSREESAALIADIRSISFEDVLGKTRDFWRTFTGKARVSTPDKRFDFMVNNWLPYQTLSCRIMARTAFYQSSGAWGLRDQLQDSLAFLLHSPEIARRQILNTGRRQFAKGDFQHWWLADSGAGVRTNISDDPVWLAYAVDQYCTATGDTAIFDEMLPFVEGAELSPGQYDAFLVPRVSAENASLYEHAALGLDLAIKRSGVNGLPLMMSGDWCDKMDRVGIDGRGESVWLGWFLAGALRQFIGYAEARGDTQRVSRWSEHLNKLKEALETAGWDGDYYRRGYYDNGAPLGSSQSDQAKIDSIAQSWSVLSGEGNPERSEMAMNAVLEKLADKEGGFIRLLTPPFTNPANDPGAIKAYPPGVRENGGQYTHAAVWTTLAFARMGRSEDAWRCFEMLNPINHSLDKSAADVYRVEPYVIAGDVYGEGALKGRGGWSWYTGSGGWLYRTAIEGILGVRVENGHLYVKPSLPAKWDNFSADLDLPSGKYQVSVSRDAAGDRYAVTVNGVALDYLNAGYRLGGH